ncbi:hypothetical protein NYO91_09455 [Arhodomonas aquaeolei]|uniref:hypothetical protein n=1 Tax=Arhodomonas aquaeolei TaxID=2369 RepID=UPI002166D4D9|nr:hypothetical protein [Arhodomonas aquaeolei]MCS4504301.1 hypothetical protein [Arhodomonas aquaeolei]
MKTYSNAKEDYVNLGAMVRDWYENGLQQPDIAELLLDYAWHYELRVSITDLKRIASQSDWAR